MKKVTPQKPFFARLLEEQELEHVAAGATQKYPSDIEEHGSFEFESVGTPPVGSTQKYPSDKDESAL